MLRVVDEVASEYGMTINAAKTEIQIQHTASSHAPAPTVTLSGGEVKAAQEFKYLGGWTQEDWGMEKEIEARRGRGMGVFQRFSRVWANRKLKVAHKMAVYNSFVMPHFLYGSETWNCTATQLHALETAHTCLLECVASWVLASQTATHYNTFAMHVAASPSSCWSSNAHSNGWDTSCACQPPGTQPWFLAVSLMVGSACEAGPRARTGTHTHIHAEKGGR